MSPIWSSTAPLKSVSKGVWHAGEMRTRGRLLQSKPAIPTSSWDATPRTQQGPAEMSFPTLQSKAEADQPCVISLCNIPGCRRSCPTGRSTLGIGRPRAPRDAEESCMQRWSDCSEAMCVSSLCNLAKGLRVPAVSHFS